jgi:lipoprotein-releasing system ATP-binding protein
MSLLVAEHIQKSYLDSNEELLVLQDVCLQLDAKDFVCISGKSGCGKSTLLHILGLLDKPDKGSIYINDKKISMDSESINDIRNKHIGFIFQFHYLLEDLTTLENIALPLMIAGLSRKDSLSKAADMLCDLDLEQRARHYPYQLSGGEQQRVALGRSLINNPAIVLADEPTGNLDPAHREDVLELFFKFNRTYSSAFILVTHDDAIADMSKNHYRLDNGILTQIK